MRLPDSQKSQLPAGPPAKIAAVLGSPPLIDGEDAGQYYELLSALGESAGARDAVDWILVDAACSIIWSLRQLRSARAVDLRHRSRLPEMVVEEDPTFRIRVLEAYDKRILNQTNRETKNRLVELRQVVEFGVGSASLPRPRHALVEIGRMLGVVQRKPRERVVTPEQRASVQLHAMRELASIDAMIERYESRLSKILSDIDRRHLVSQRLREISRLMIDATIAERAEKADLEERDARGP